MDKLKKAATDYFDEGFNCAESALLALSDFKKLDCGCIPNVASGFGGGVGRSGEICGVITGAVMAMGIVHGRSRQEGKDSKTKERIYELVSNFVKNFQSKFGSLKCIELTGCDFSTAEGSNKFKSEKIHSNICSKLLEFAVSEAMKLL